MRDFCNTSRYSRQICLDEIGDIGQAALAASQVEVCLPEDLGATTVVLAYLAAAGVGALLLSGDHSALVKESDVASGLLLTYQDVGKARSDCLKLRLRQQNTLVRVEVGDAIIKTLPMPQSTDIAANLVSGGAEAQRLILELVK